MANSSILIVDDEPELRELISIILNDAGFHSLTAACGEDAFQIIEKSHDHIEAILTDVRMPNGTGLDLINNCQRQSIFIPTILMSGFADITQQEAKTLGAIDIISKPLNFESLISILNMIRETQ